CTPGHADQTARRPGPPRRSVRLGCLLPGALPANTIRTCPDRGVCRGSRRGPLGGIGLPARGHRADGGEHRRRRCGDQRARRHRRSAGARRLPGRGQPRAVPAGASGRAVALAVYTDPLAPHIGAHKVRRSSGDIAVEDALTAQETLEAIDAGRRIADQEVDAGAARRIAGDMGIGNTTPATVLVAAVTGVEPVAAVGYGTGISDAGWARKTKAVRDALFRAQPVLAAPAATLQCCGGADLAGLAGFCAQAAVRRTPVLLDGQGG